MTADEILKAAERRIAEIDVLVVTLAAEREKLKSMVASAKPAPTFPVLPMAPLEPPFWPEPFPGLPYTPPYMPTPPPDDHYRFTLPIVAGTKSVDLIIGGGESVLMDGFSGCIHVTGGASFRLTQTVEQTRPF